MADPVEAPEDPVAKFEKVLGGLGQLYGFFAGDQKEKEKKEFQEALIKALKKIDSDLAVIEKDQQAILAELKKIGKDIQWLGLSPVFVSIQDWGDKLAALKPDDNKGRVHLANAMSAGSSGAIGVSAAMIKLNQAMTGGGSGDLILISQLSAEHTLGLRTWLFKGLHLWGFVCAFSDTEKFNFGVYLWEWSLNFRKQMDMLLSIEGKTKLVEPEAWVDFPIYVSDTIALYESVQPFLDGVGLYLETETQHSLIHSGTLTHSKAKTADYNPVREPLRRHVCFDGLEAQKIGANGETGTYLYVDLTTGKSSTDANSALARKCRPAAPFNQWMKVLLSMGPYGHHPNPLGQMGRLRAAAWGEADKTFLGAAGGQLASVAKDKPYTGSILAGKALDAPMLVYDPKKQTVKAVAQDDLGHHFDLKLGLWVVNWTPQRGFVSIVPYVAKGDPTPPTLYLDERVEWVISDAGESEPIQVIPQATAPQRMANPLTMPPTWAMLSRNIQHHGGASGLFYQF